MCLDAIVEYVNSWHEVFRPKTSQTSTRIRTSLQEHHIQRAMLTACQPQMALPKVPGVLYRHPVS